MKKFENFKPDNWNPGIIDKNIRYIICPDSKCDGFLKDKLQCTARKYPDISPEAEVCPYPDIAKTVVFCYWGHPNERKVNESGFYRVDCTYPDCSSMTFALNSSKLRKIPLEHYEEFLKLPIKK